MTSSSALNMIQNFLRTLWLSASSREFYRDVYYRYRGYGLKYLLMVISVTSIIYTIVFTHKLLELKSYLEDTSEDATNPIEYILKQIPEMEYDGHKLNKDPDEPIFITTINGMKLIAVDTSNTLAKGKVAEFPIVLLKDKALVLLTTGRDQEIKPTGFSYEQILGKTEMTVDSKLVKEIIISWIQPLNLGFTLLLLPVVIILRIGVHIFRNIFNSSLLYGILWWRKLSPTIPSVSRLILFSSGPAEIFYALALVFYPPLLPLTFIIDSWTILLAAYSIAVSKK